MLNSDKLNTYLEDKADALDINYYYEAKEFNKEMHNRLQGLLFKRFKILDKRIQELVKELGLLYPDPSTNRTYKYIGWNIEGDKKYRGKVLIMIDCEEIGEEIKKFHLLYAIPDSYIKDKPGTHNYEMKEKEQRLKYLIPYKKK